MPNMSQTKREGMEIHSMTVFRVFCWRWLLGFCALSRIGGRQDTSGCHKDKNQAGLRLLLCNTVLFFFFNRKMASCYFLCDYKIK